MATILASADKDSVTESCVGQHRFRMYVLSVVGCILSKSVTSVNV